MVASSIRTNALDTFGTSASHKTDPYKTMDQAGALFGLEKRPLSEFANCPANTDLHVVVRTDTGQAIGQVGNNYEVMPNEDFFGPVSEALIKTGAEITRFQMLDNGTRSFMRLAWPDDYNLSIGDPQVGDIVGRRAILSTSHDGKYAGKFTIQMLRLVCSNGMTVPVGSFDMALTHTVGGSQQLVELSKMIPTIETYVRQFQVAAEILAEVQVKAGSKQAMTIIHNVVDGKKSAGKKKDGSPNLAQARVNRVAELFVDQPGVDNKAVKDTGWGLYNACVDYFTHDQNTRGGDVAEQRFKSLLPGGPAQREIVRAWDVVTTGLKVRGKIKEALATVN